MYISPALAAQVALYDPLVGTTFTRFFTQRLGITHSSGIIIGTLNVTPTNQVTVSFVGQVGVPTMPGETAT